jgi:hypothetical protein
MHVFPHAPRYDPVFGSWLLWEHRDVLEEMAVRIAEETLPRSARPQLVAHA